MKTPKFVFNSSRVTILGVGIASLLFFTACSEDKLDSPELGIDDATLEAETMAQSDFDEVDDITSNIMSVAESSTGGRVADKNDDRCHCAEITHDKENKTITIDFGDACKGPNGVVRSGIIFITYDGHRFVPGSSWTVTFRNYYVNNRHIEGLRTVTNVSESLESNPTFHITLEGGKVTWPDETVARREVDKTRVWVRATNPLMDEFHILAGSTTTGTNRREVAYKTEVLEDLIYKRNCRTKKRTRIPVQGIKQITKREKTCTIDFGDGECDNLTDRICDDDVSTVNVEE